MHREAVDLAVTHHRGQASLHCRTTEGGGRYHNAVVVNELELRQTEGVQPQAGQCRNLVLILAGAPAVVWANVISHETVDLLN